MRTLRGGRAAATSTSKRSTATSAASRSICDRRTRPAVLDALIARADVLVESFRPSTARRLGVDAATLRATHPRLICASISGFGQSGPYEERAAHDINYQALAGLLRPPALPGPLIGDIGAAMQAALGILAALVQRDRAPAPAASSTCRFTKRRWRGRCFRPPAIWRTPATTSTRRRTASGSRWARSSRSSGPASASGSISR